MSFTKDDEIKYKAFKKVLAKGKFEVQGEAVILMASLFNWFNYLETKIVEKKVEPIKKPKSGPIENGNK